VKKLVLVVIDALKPSMLERAIASGRAPALKRIADEGVYVDDCVAAFPSVTPVCAATITTGVGPDRHLIPSMNWYHREEGRYVEYGSSFSASRQFGVLRSLTDTVYRMNAEHLAADALTVFESLDDVDVRTAGTTYLIYRGRHQHEVAQETALARIVTSTLFRRTILGPKELFYADIYASRKTGCRGQLGMPGIRDQHTGCVGAYLVEHDLFDFLLFSLPDNDAWSHRNGPHAQVTSIAAADRQLERLMHAAGGPDAFLEEHAVIVTSDHSQAAVEERIRLDHAFEEFDVATPSVARSTGAEVALSPGQRSAMVYVLDEDQRDEVTAKAIAAVEGVDGIDLVLWLGGEAREEAVVLSGRGELRFAPGGELEDDRGYLWSIEGEAAALDLRIEDGRVRSPDYPLALSRIWSALRCSTAGDVLLSASPGYEFVDWGGADHVGGGSHGSLHSSDSVGALMWCGTGPASRAARDRWSLQDVAPMIRAHFDAQEPAEGGRKRNENRAHG
jgi:predicted AlkP superfamily pyrophosphatase or phosphodiesterase